MSRRYLEPVQVRTGADHAPHQFLWRGRRYWVRAVLAHWVEGGTWWRRLQRGGSLGPVGDREVWRVEAGRSAGGPRSTGPAGVYDLCRDAPPEQWHLARTLD